MSGPWTVRFFAILFFITVDASLRSLAVAIALCLPVFILARLLYAAGKLPRFVMDVLDRFTDKKALEEQFARQQQALTVIDAEELAAHMKSRVIGQDAVAEHVARQIRRRIAARRTDKPVAVFCFAGPPGVGKTYFAKVLAEKLYGGPKNLAFFDMSQFGQPHAAASLFGQAKGYVGSDSYGSLTKALRDVPNAVVLLDEFEKAHPEVHKRFLTAWNDGFVTETSDGAKISTKDAIFILTTNAAARAVGEIAGRGDLDREAQSRELKQALQEARFAPEVLSRIDEVFAFRSLAGLDIARVVALEMDRLVRQYGLEIAEGGIDPAILMGAINRASQHAGSNVRDIARAIEQQITDSVIDARTDGASRIRLVASGDKVRAEPAAPPAPSPEALA